MTKWEYLCVERHYDVQSPNKPWRVNDRELPNWKRGPTIYEYVNQLGDQGWELFSVSGEYWFKRPKLEVE